jgi:transcriptional regulator with XRE-family HTH domain
MTRRPRTLTASQSSRTTGVVSGFVLKLVRQSAALTQEKLAEALGVDVTTVQGWESGRRPLSAVSAGEFLRLCGRLARLGAPAATGRHSARRSKRTRSCPPESLLALDGSSRTAIHSPPACTAGPSPT